MKSAKEYLNGRFDFKGNGYFVDELTIDEMAEVLQSYAKEYASACLQKAANSATVERKECTAGIVTETDSALCWKLSYDESRAYYTVNKGSITSPDNLV